MWTLIIKTLLRLKQIKETLERIKEVKESDRV